MRRVFRNGALAFALVAGAALVSAPATAGSIQRDGYFGGTWSPIGPKHNRHVRRFDRKYGYYPGRYAYYGPSGYYGPRYYSGRRAYYRSPGVSFGIGIY